MRNNKYRHTGKIRLIHLLIPMYTYYIAVDTQEQNIHKCEMKHKNIA